MSAPTCIYFIRRWNKARYTVTARWRNDDGMTEEDRLHDYTHPIPWADACYEADCDFQGLTDAKKTHPHISASDLYDVLRSIPKVRRNSIRVAVYHSSVQGEAGKVLAAVRPFNDFKRWEGHEAVRMVLQAGAHHVYTVTAR
jgi:hypothetical protein